MGLLAETKIRRRINHDPNNTKWTRDETTFGQKILRSHGWQPGEFLGAKDAPHSELHTAASASYIRVSLKDDMKGLGFDKAKDNEISGLDAFTDVLSRLNGKSAAAVEEDKQARMVVKLNRYVEQKFGPMRFVRGGLLVGDELKEEPETKDSPAAVAKPSMEDTEQSQQKSKKRKASSQSEDDEDSSGKDSSGKDSESKLKKRRKDGEKKSKKRSSEESEDNDSSDVARKEKKKSKKDKSRQQSAATSADESECTERASKLKSETDVTGEDEEEDVKESKQAKKERKEEKRARKELKKQEKKEKKEKKEEKKKRRKREADSSSERDQSTSATPSGSGTSTPRGNPHLVRSRFLAAKREAMLNDNSINKIFMVKA